MASRRSQRRTRTLNHEKRMRGMPPTSTPRYPALHSCALSPHALTQEQRQVQLRRLKQSFSTTTTRNMRRFELRDRKSVV